MTWSHLFIVYRPRSWRTSQRLYSRGLLCWRKIRIFVRNLDYVDSLKLESKSSSIFLALESLDRFDSWLNWNANEVFLWSLFWKSYQYCCLKLFRIQYTVFVTFLLAHHNHDIQRIDFSFDALRKFVGAERRSTTKIPPSNELFVNSWILKIDPN